MQYNEEQQALIDAPIDEIVIGASAAGSGKSTTLVGRARKILKSYPSGNVMLISFTRNAADELRDKLSETLTDDEMKRVITGTYHSIMSRFIRAKAIEVGLNPNFSIVDESSTKVLYRRLLENAHEYTELFRKWMLKPTDYQDGKSLGKTEYGRIAGTLSSLVNNAHPTNLLTGKFDKDVYARLRNQDFNFARLNKVEAREVVEALYNIFKESIEHSRETNVITYDMILFVSYLMAQNGLLDSFKQTIIHTIVDEFQDSNYLQDAWVQAIAGTRLTLIGDVDQSIYSFRGGRPEIMDEYTKVYKVYNLSTNYRSLQEILDIGNRVIAINTEGQSSRKPMKAHRTPEGLKAIKWYETADDSQEAEHVLNTIKALHEQGGIAYEDMAILIRSRAALPILKQKLSAAQLPINDTTKFADFMKSEVMVDMMNFLKIMTNPKDIYAFMATLDRPKRGIGAVALKKLEGNAAKHEQSLVEYILSDNIDELTPALKKKVQAYSTVYNELIQHNKDMNLQQAVEFLLERTGYLTWIDGLKDKQRYLGHVEMLHQVVNEYMTKYEEEQGDQEYTLFDIATNFTFDMASSVKEEHPEGVTIATIHGAKGLEWKVVFVVGVEDGVFPMRNNPEELQDERRLMYVATTRAKDILLYYTTNRRVAVQRPELEPSELMLETGLSPVCV